MLSDGGYLMDKDTLPVMEINIGNRTGDVFTLGPLECYGAVSENQGMFTIYNDLYHLKIAGSVK